MVIFWVYYKKKRIMKTTIKKVLTENKSASLNSKVKIDKKLDNLKVIESNKQEEVNKLTFNLNL